MDKPALVSLTFDDGLRCQFDQAVPLLDQHGFPATFFLIANTLPWHERPEWRKIEWNVDDIAMLKKLVERGHEIGSHTVSHHSATMRNQAAIEARKSKQLIEGWLGATVSSFCYPFYDSSYLADAVKNAGYEQARGGCRASHYAIPDNGSLDRFNVDCREITVNENVGEWVRPECWHVLTFHGIGGEHDGWAHITLDQYASQMAELARHRDNGAVEVVTFKDGAERLRQQ
jgi:peptidoglycan/xylan/chitin deacetylase (PgdA/CDA1 family)